MLALCLVFGLIAWLAAPVLAQEKTVEWRASIEPTSPRAGEHGWLAISGDIQEPWFIYAPSTPPGGPIGASVRLAQSPGVEAAGELRQSPPARKLDEGFGIEVDFYERQAHFALPVRFTGEPGSREITIAVRSQSCNDRLCLPPSTEEIRLAFDLAPGEARPEFVAVPPAPDFPNQTAPVPSDSAVGDSTVGDSAVGDSTVGDSAVGDSTVGDSTVGDNVAGVVVASGDDGGAAGVVARAQERGLLAFAGVAFAAGFLAVFTPCVFPMIPITISLFAKRGDALTTGEAGRALDTARALAGDVQASRFAVWRGRWGGRVSSLAGPLAYCAGIVGTFTLLGVAVSAVFGAAGLTLLAAHPLVNIALALLFVLLALNLFGAYEIMVPPALLARVTPRGDRAGLVAPLLMGFAFTLTSFTCTVPFVGTTLVTAATVGALYPAVGMLAFSTAFAMPFFLLALFPRALARLPRGGQWLVSFKATLGFVELAAAVKFFSTADYVLGWGLLTRPVFLALWFAVALVAGLYLLAWVRLPHDESPRSPIGWTRRGLGVGSLGVAGWMLMAQTGTSLGELDAFLPPRDYGSTTPMTSAWLKNDLEGARQQARQSGKPLLINFTGYACTNCRLMENNVLPHPAVTRELDDFVAVELYTDGTDEKSRSFNRFQEETFGTVAIPLYAVVTPEGQIEGRLEGLERDPQKFAAFLRASRERLAASAANAAGNS